MSRASQDRADIPIDYRNLDAAAPSSGGPSGVVGVVCEGSKARSGSPNATVASTVTPRSEGGDSRTRRTLWRDRKKRAAEQGVWRQNYSSVAEWSEECSKIMNDQAERGQVLRLSEEEARQKFPALTVASLGAIKKEKPGGEVTARILFDGTHGIDVNTRIRIRDQERAPIAADVKRVLREKANPHSH